MPRKPTLTVVGESATSLTSVPSQKSFVDALQSEDRRELLVAMRTRVASALADPNTPARDLAALTRRQMEIAREITAIDAEPEVLDGPDAADEAWDESAI